MEKVFQNLNVISVSKKMEVDLRDVDFDLRNKLLLFKKDISLRGFKSNLNLLLSDEDIIDLLNSIQFSPIQLRFLLESYNENFNNNFEFKKSLKNTLKLSSFKESLNALYNIVLYTSDERAGILCDIIQYIHKKELHTNKLFKEMVRLYFRANSFLKSNEGFDKNTILRLSFSTYVLNYLNRDFEKSKIIELFSKLKNVDINNLDYLVDYSSNTKILNLLSSLYFSLVEDESKIIHFMSKLESFDSFEKSIFLEYIFQISNKSNTLTFFEFEKICEIIKEKNSIDDIFSFIYSNNEIILIDKLEKHHIDYLKFNLKKKSFLKLINEDMNSFISLNEENILFNTIFNKIVNINTLNTKNLKYLNNTTSIDNKNYLSKEHLENIKILDTSKKLTFNEFLLLIKKDKISIDLFYLLYDLNVKVDSRINLLKELPNLIDIKEKYNIDIETKLDYLANLLINNSFKNRIYKLKNTYNNLNSIKDDCFIIIILYEDILIHCLKDILHIDDVLMIVNNSKEFEESKLSLFEFKVKKIKSNYYFDFLINCLEVSDDFVNKNINSILEFFRKDLHIVFYTIMNSNQKDFQKDNLKKIVKAELLNKLSSIKFIKEDYDLEIGMNVSELIKNEWENNLIVINKENKLRETYDFNEIIRLGEIPVSTCQHWNGGLYSRCLLSNFDTNKKMIVNEKEDYINTRALIRLTKGTFDESKAKLSIRDIESEDNYEKKESGEETILFLEKTYSNLDNTQLISVQKEIINLALKKARLMKIPLIVSNYYEEALQHLKPLEYNIFISRSKNGYQYLDSLDGQAESSSEGKYTSCLIYYLK